MGVGASDGCEEASLEIQVECGSGSGGRKGRAGGGAELEGGQAVAQCGKGA